MIPFDVLERLYASGQALLAAEDARALQSVKLAAPVADLADLTTPTSAPRTLWRITPRGIQLARITDDAVRERLLSRFLTIDAVRHVPGITPETARRTFWKT